MKTKSSFLSTLSTVAAAALVMVLWASAQTPPVLELQLYAGLTVEQLTRAQQPATAASAEIEAKPTGSVAR